MLLQCHFVSQTEKKDAFLHETFCLVQLYICRLYELFVYSLAGWEFISGESQTFQITDISF